ncbi:MAG: beta-galactosidase [Abditibacteriota bacterium]|nr:beta-galactosidase [Abditibacteriota bacterium]
MALDFFPYGVNYYRQPTPLPDEWAIDLKNIKEAGYTHIQLTCCWKWAERIEGEFSFNDIDTLMNLAQENNLKVILMPMVESAPDWIFTKYEGERMGYKGVPIPPEADGDFYLGGFIPCFDNPIVNNKACGFAKTFAARYKDHPALWMFNVWNNPISSPAGGCQCEHSKKAFIEFLKDRFHSVESLNALFGKAFTSFDTINPPYATTDYVEMMLWKFWSSLATSQHIKDISNAIKEVAPNKPVMCHIKDGQMLNNPLDEATNDMANASAVDIYASNFPLYNPPKNAEEGSMPTTIGDWMRRVDPNFWIHDFSPITGEWGKAPNDNDLRRLIWQAIATGCNGLTFSKYRNERVGNTSNSLGMREINGKETSRSKICDDIAKILKKIDPILSKSKRKLAEVAQIYHYEEDLLSRLEEWQNPMGIEHSKKVFYKYKNSMLHQHGIFAAVLVNGMDFVTWSDDFSKYKVICCAGDEIITPNMARKLKEYVKEGGNLIVEFPFACRDMTTWVSTERPNNGLEELLGVREVAHYEEDHTAAFSTATFKHIPIYIEGEPVGEPKVFGIWDNGKPCAFENSYGKGKVFSILASFSSVNYIESSTATFIARYIFNQIGISPILPYGLIIRNMEDEETGQHMVFMFNFCPEDQTVNFDISNCTIIDKNNCLIQGGQIIIKRGGFIVLHD